MTLGYVITNNRIGSEAGFFTPFPRFVSNVNRRLGGHWDYEDATAVDWLIAVRRYGPKKANQMFP
jgi:hypothetical protein